MKTFMRTLLLFSGLFYFGCSNSTDPNYNKYYDRLTNADAKTAIALGNEWKYSASKIKTHVTPQEVVIEFPDSRTVKKSLPADQMYIAVAPYINGTHACETHYPSSCEGEMKELTVSLIAKDGSGNFLYNGNIETMKNGFFELWLPRNQNITLQISYNSLSGSETIQTNSNSRTCITTIKLK